jgi:hypothetical protein
VTLAEVLATSDVPPGVVNILTGRTAEIAPVLAAHMDVNAIDLTGVAAADRAGLERLADPAYREGQLFIAPGLRADDTIGVRLPLIMDIANEPRPAKSDPPPSGSGPVSDN